MRIKLYLSIGGLFFLALFGLSKEVWACESCMIPQLGRQSGVTAESGDKKWFFKYLFERQDWKEIDAHDAHTLHHQGHDAHDKTVEEFYHFGLGRHINDRLTLSADVPYVVRQSLEIDDHAHVGDEERSQGFGDLLVTGEQTLLKKDNSSLGLLGGVKFPTGKTGDRNSRQVKFEPELQPGSGSFDYLAGGVVKTEMDQWSAIFNAVYVLKNKGRQGFESGDLFTTSLLAEHPLNPGSKGAVVNLGADLNFQYEQKQRDHGQKVADSGGTTLFLGPSLSLKANEHVTFIGSWLYPVSQNMGGVHQELKNAWTLGGTILW